MLTKSNEKNKVHHYNLFEFQHRNSNKFGCNASRRYIETIQKTKENTFTNIIDPTEYGYYLPLIEGELQLIIYDEGNGNYPAIGQYISFKQKVYYEGEGKDINRQTINSIIGKNSNPEPIHYILSISRAKFKARAILGENMASKLPCIANKKKNNRPIVLQIQVLFISDYPFQSGLSELQNFHAEIVKNVIEGDRAFEHRDIEGSLSYYEKVAQKIFSQYYYDTLTANKRSIIKQENEEYRKKGINQQERQGLQMNEGIELNGDLGQVVRVKRYIQEIEQFSEKASLKAIQVALFAGQYLKVTKWAGLFLRNPKYETNIRALLARSHAFLQLQEFDRALKDLNLIKILYPENKFVEDQVKKICQQKQQYFAKREKIEKAMRKKIK